MKRLNLLCTALLGISSLVATAQINQTPVHTGGGQIYVAGEKMQAATGSMFTEDKYMPAKVSNNDQTLLLRYNAYSDFFDMSNPQEGTVKVLPKQNNIVITFNQTGESYTLVNYKTEKGEAVNGYLNIVSDNPKVKIYKRERVYLQAGSIAANSYQSSKAPAYKRAADEFYIKTGEGEAVFFSGKKDLAKLVSGKSKEVLEFIKTNKTDLENETDLQKLGAYINTVL